MPRKSRPNPTSFFRIAFGFGALALVLVACGSGSGDAGAPVPFADASIDLRNARISPKICAGPTNGKRFSVVGYPHWSDGTVSSSSANGSVAFVHLFESNGPDGRPTAEAHVPLVVKVRGLFGFGGPIEEPQLENTSSSTSMQGRNRNTKTVGTISDESMKLHLVDGSVVNHTAKIRVTLEVEGGNGHCNLNYVSARREP